MPAKLGDVYAAHLARINFKIRRSAALGSIVFLRMIDAWIILLLAAAACWVLFADRLPGAVLWSLIGGAIIAVGATGHHAGVFFIQKATSRLDSRKNPADDSIVSYRHVAQVHGIYPDCRFNPHHLGAGNRLDFPRWSWLLACTSVRLKLFF